MSRPERQPITIVVDGFEVTTAEGTMLVDAAKGGDIEIPVFCYEPKLGDPVGACRMCLVEIEGIPKLQTACSTPVRDGMVVHTRNDRVKEAQNAVVEFLLVNHPLDCPVCDKGGECPLQDISMGWGKGTSRVTDPKRHFQKPIPLSPLIKIDRERCILCYRCVRFSQEVSEDEQLQLLERGADSFVGTHEDRPYIAPFHGNIIELCPVGALTSHAYRFRARPWDIEDAGSVCTLCPGQCNVKFSVRDEQVVRVHARDNEEVDDGWLCDRGRFGYQMFSSADRVYAPQINVGGTLEATDWGDALQRAARGLGAAQGKVAAIVGGGTSNEEGWLIQRLVRGALGSADVTGTERAGLSRTTRTRLADPSLGLAMAEIDHADAILLLGCDPMHEMPSLELRIRKAVRRNGARLLVATERPTALDGGAAVDSSGCLEAHRFAPGEGGAFIEELRAALKATDDADPAPGAGAIAAALGEADSVAIIWSERLLAGEDREAVAGSLTGLAGELGVADNEDSGLLEVPRSANGRGLREVGCAEDFGPGYATVDSRGRSAEQIREALASGELDALILSDVDPLRDFDDPEAWKSALASTGFILSISQFESASSKAADIHLPAETHAEKEGTVVHPDGRLQRVRPSVPHPEAVRPIWQALSDLSAQLGDDPNAGSASELFDLIAAEVPFYKGIDVDKIGAQGIRPQQHRAEQRPTGSTDKTTDATDPTRPAGPDAAQGPGPTEGGAPGVGAASPSHEGPAAGGSSGGTQHPPNKLPSIAVSPPSAGAPTGDPPAAGPGEQPPEAPAPGVPPAANEITLGTYRDLWSGYVTEQNPALRFLQPQQTLELHPDDAAALGLQAGQRVEIDAGEDGPTIFAHVGLRERMLPGSAFLVEGTASDQAGSLSGTESLTVTPAPADEPPVDATGEGDGPDRDAEGEGGGEEAKLALTVTKREPVSWS